MMSDDTKTQEEIADEIFKTFHPVTTGDPLADRPPETFDPNRFKYYQEEVDISRASIELRETRQGYDEVLDALKELVKIHFNKELIINPIDED